MTRIELQVGPDRFVALARGPADGPVVLLLHGFPDVPASWGPVMERLAEAGHRCVAPFMRGYRPSTARGPFHADRLAADAVALAEALSPRAPVHLVGHDWGAATAYVAATRAPERFASLVTLSVPHPLTFLGALRRRPAQLRRSWYMAFFQLPRLPERALRRGLVERLWRDWSPGFTPPRAHLDEVVDTVVASLPAPVEYYRAMTRPVREAAARVLDARADRVEVPTLYLHGREDGCIAPDVARGQERWFAAPLSTGIVEGAGHFVPLERPDAVADAARRWIARHGAMP
jgi:pimeloyl-ACP methyl ester carboxylesterase